MQEISETDRTASDLYSKRPAAAIRFITDYSVNTGNNTVMQWKELYKFLFAKYLDGNVKVKQPVPKGYKSVSPKLDQPGYGEEWYRRLVESTGDKFREKQ